MKKITYPEDIRDSIREKEQRGTLYEYVANPTWTGWDQPISAPVRSVVRVKDEAELTRVTNWAQSWKYQEKRLPGTVLWESKDIRYVGKMLIPKRFQADGIQQLFEYAGFDVQWKTFKGCLAYARYSLPEIESWIAQEHRIFSDSWKSRKLSLFISLAKWMKSQTGQEPLRYVRELGIPGIDTKFIETHQREVRSLYNYLTQRKIRTHEELLDTLHIRTYPEDTEFVLLRLIPPVSAANLSLMQVYYEDLKKAKISPRHVFIIENKTTCYHFPAIPDSVILFGNGKASKKFLAEVPFIGSAKNRYYWSDIDTDGFHMLSNMRELYPDIQSLFMDKETIQEATTYAVPDTGSEFEQLPHLTPEESFCFQYIAQKRLRIEQERIPWEYIKKVLKSL